MSSKLREALEEIWNSANYIHRYPCSFGVVIQHSQDIMDMVDKVIAEPIRNCEVGTVEEQIKRWQKFCDTQTRCEECPCNREGDITATCFARWAQMPCESEVNK